MTLDKDNNRCSQVLVYFTLIKSACQLKLAVLSPIASPLYYFCWRRVLKPKLFYFYESFHFHSRGCLCFTNLCTYKASRCGNGLWLVCFLKLRWTSVSCNMCKNSRDFFVSFGVDVLCIEWSWERESRRKSEAWSFKKNFGKSLPKYLKMSSRRMKKNCFGNKSSW